VEVNVGLITLVGVWVAVISRRVGDGVGVGVAVGEAVSVPVAVALGVKVAVAVFVAGITVGVAALVASAAGTTLVAVLVTVGVSGDTSPGPTMLNAVAQMPSNTSRPVAAPSILLRLFTRRA
jgi:hypothetical protein